MIANSTVSSFSSAVYTFTLKSINYKTVFNVDLLHLAEYGQYQGGNESDKIITSCLSVV